MPRFFRGGALPAERRKAVWKFLNTPFVLLIVSSIILAGIGKLFSDWQAAQVQRQKDRQERINLYIELGFRVSLLDMSLQEVGQGEKDACLRTWQIVTGDDEYHPAIAEYKNTHIVGLIAKVDRSREDDRRILVDAANKAILLDAELARRRTKTEWCNPSSASLLEKLEEPLVSVRDIAGRDLEFGKH